MGFSFSAPQFKPRQGAILDSPALTRDYAAFGCYWFLRLGKAKIERRRGNDPSSKDATGTERVVDA